MKTTFGGGAMMTLPWIAPASTRPTEPVAAIISIGGVLLVLINLWLIHRSQLKIIEKAGSIDSADIPEALRAVTGTKDQAKAGLSPVGRRRRSKSGGLRGARHAPADTPDDSQ